MSEDENNVVKNYCQKYEELILSLMKLCWLCEVPITVEIHKKNR